MREPTENEVSQLARLKQYFPYRIVFGVINKDSQEFETFTVTTMHKPNKFVKLGHCVFIYK